MKIVYTYRVVCQKLSAPELGPYITYGILAARDLRGCQQVVQFISDVSLAVSYTHLTLPTIA